MIFYLSTIANLSTILARVVVLARRTVLIWHLINFESGYLCKPFCIRESQAGSSPISTRLAFSPTLTMSGKSWPKWQ